ncbi:MAG: protein YgfX [Pseudomonadota bacterium]
MRQYKLRASRYLAVLLIAAYSGTFAALLAVGLPLWAKVLLGLLLLCALIYHLRRDAWLTASSANVALILQGERAMLVKRNGKQVIGSVSRDSVATPFLTILNILPQGAHVAHSVVILPDSLDAESFRQLRVWLKWESQTRS